MNGDGEPVRMHETLSSGAVERRKDHSLCILTGHQVPPASSQVSMPLLYLWHKWPRALYPTAQLLIPSIFVPSRNFIRNNFIFTSRSLPKMMNSTGALTDPCRATLEMFPFSDNSLLTTTFWDLSVTQFLIHLTCASAKVYSANILIIVSCGIKSNALHKFKYIISTQLSYLPNLQSHQIKQVCLTRHILQKWTLNGINYIPYL